MIQQNEKSTQDYIRPIWDRSYVCTKGLGKTLDKGQQLQEPSNIHTQMYKQGNYTS